MKNIKQFIKENLFFIIMIIFTIVICYVKLPYYIESPGGIINVYDRIKVDNKQEMNGTLNLLYVTTHEANIPSFLLSLVLKDWDLSKIEEMQVSNETTKEIDIRNKVMLDNSRQNAIIVAYNKANKEVKINRTESTVIATTENNNLKIGDIILSANGIKIDSVKTLKTIINNSNEEINLKIKRDNKEMEITAPITTKDDEKQIGIVIVTNYDYELNPKIDIKFKNSEGGSSGGLMLALNIYNALTEEDITHSHKIAGTGTIDINGNVGKIDGIKYKIIGAYKNKMELVFVPEENYEEAIKVAKERKYNMKIISIKTFDEALKYLKENIK